jgi:branched-chain amino acid transport system substrate-binding protein
MNAVQRTLAIVAATALAAAGCGRPADPALVKIVSSLPRTGSAKQQSDTIVRGIRMAIEEAGGRAGPFRVEYLDLDDATAAAGQWTSEAEAANARRALQDPDVCAYIGTFNSGAAKVSMPILNLGDLLMVSPANTASVPRASRASTGPRAASTTRGSCRPTTCRGRCRPTGRRAAG